MVLRYNDEYLGGIRIHGADNIHNKEDDPNKLGSRNIPKWAIHKKNFGFDEAFLLQRKVLNYKTSYPFN